MSVAARCATAHHYERNAMTFAIHAAAVLGCLSAWVGGFTFVLCKAADAADEKEDTCRTS